MNKINCDILKCLIKNNSTNQREIAKNTGYSLGKVNKSVQFLRNGGYINNNLQVTEKTTEIIKLSSPDSAIILAAGKGLRLTPLCYDAPKGLLTIQNEVIIERLIKQLHKANIKDIYIVVGFMKEKFEYLIDKFNVRLVVCKDYNTKNNLYSLSLIADKLRNTYVIPADLWFEENPFDAIELNSWYAVSDTLSDKSNIRINSKYELVLTSETEPGNREIGLSYLTGEQALFVTEKLCRKDFVNANSDAFWETALIKSNKYVTPAKKIESKTYFEINTYNDLLSADPFSLSLNSQYINIICDKLQVKRSEISNFSLLKSGMTNRSFLFKCKNKRYIFRIPGEGTEKLISRKQEANVYKAIKDMNLGENTIYFDAENGYKISEFIENTHNCDPQNFEEVKKCISFLKSFHQMNLQVEHSFDLFEQIEYYESLRNKASAYTDYAKTKQNVFSLKEYIDNAEKSRCLTHIDAVPDNFILSDKRIFLIDWEYSSMQDPHVDIAMFAIYSMYTKEETDRLIDIYFDGRCSNHQRLKIYCYMSVCGFLWSNWCEYKSALGVDFGEYSLQQYRYAKEYYKYFTEELNNA